MALDSILKQVQAAAVGEATQQATTMFNIIPAYAGPNPVMPRGYASPQDSYDTEIGFNSPFETFSPGANRKMWSVPDVALTHSPVSSLLSSAVPATTIQDKIIGGTSVGVIAGSSTNFTPVPNMQLVQVINGPVQLTATLPLQSNVNTDTVQLVFYRNGNPVSQIYSQTLPTANTATFATLTFVDPEVDLHGALNQEQYALYWKAGTGTLTSPGNSRSINLLSLTPS